MTELIDVGGYRIATEISGGDDRPWIVLSNGLGTTRRMWEPQLPFLEPHRRVLRYDTRGHGESDVPPGPYPLSGLVLDVVALLDHFGIERCDFMGLSLGGRTGLGLGLDHGHRVNRLIIADTRADTPDAEHKAWDERSAMAKRDGLSAVWPGSRARWFTTASIKGKADMISEIERDYTSMSLDGYRSCVAALKQTDFLRRLGSLSVPTCYIGGAEDSGAPPDLMRAMAAATPNASYFEVASAAHVANIDNPEGFNAGIAAFLGIGSVFSPSN